jgi:hypothetical protein
MNSSAERGWQRYEPFATTIDFRNTANDTARMYRCLRLFNMPWNLLISFEAIKIAVLPATRYLGLARVLVISKIHSSAASHPLNAQALAYLNNSCRITSVRDVL